MIHHLSSTRCLHQSLYVPCRFKYSADHSGHSHQAVHEWYTALADLFEPEPDEHGTVVVDETKVVVDDREVYVWAAIDRHSYEVIHVEASPGRSELDALLFLQTVLERCRGRPVIIVDRGPWYNWSLDDLDLPCESRRETGVIARSSNRGSARSSSGSGGFSIGFRIGVRGNQLTAGRKHSR